MIKTFKIQLHPTKEQEQLMWQSAGTARWAYNHALDKQMKHFKATGKKLSAIDIYKEFTQLKKTEEYQWLNNVSAQIPKQAVKDLDLAYQKFFDIQKTTKEKYTKKTIKNAQQQNRKLTVYDMNGHPKFKSKRKVEPKFYNDNVKLKINKDTVLLEKIGWVNLAEQNEFIKNAKYSNPRVMYDGFHWYLTVGNEAPRGKPRGASF